MLNPKLIAAAVSGSVALSLFFFTRPSLPLIIGFIVTFTLFLYFLATILLPKKYWILTGSSTALFLTITYLVGFQIVNTLLFISVIIGIIVLIRQRHE